MPDAAVRYPRYRFPTAIISEAVWLYYRFTLSFRDVEDLLAQRGITVVGSGNSGPWIERTTAAYLARDAPLDAEPVDLQSLDADRTGLADSIQLHMGVW